MTGPRSRRRRGLFFFFFFCLSAQHPQLDRVYPRCAILQQGMHLNVFSKVYCDRVYFSCAERIMTGSGFDTPPPPQRHPLSSWEVECPPPPRQSIHTSRHKFNNQLRVSDVRTAGWVPANRLANFRLDTRHFVCLNHIVLQNKEKDTIMLIGQDCIL